MKAIPEILTPGQAAELASNPVDRQRKISHSWVDILADRIKRGEWDQWAGVIIVCNGRLADGNHRCHAIAKAGLLVFAILLEVQSDSQWTDDTRRRSVADRNMQSKTIAAATRMAGRWTGTVDPDLALREFERLAESASICRVSHQRPWSCAGVHVGLMAAHAVGPFGSLETLNRITQGDAVGDSQRRLLRLAASGKLASTGTGQLDTAVEVFSALVGKRQTPDSLRSALVAGREK